MAWAFEKLVKLYDKLEADGRPVCPVAHTYISAHIGVLIDKDGNFLLAKEPEIKGELVAVPCTIESEGRTSGTAPHLLSDNLSYVCKYPGKEGRYKAYIKQLSNYIKERPSDEYAKAIYQYTLNGSLMQDIKDVLDNIKILTPKDKINIIFCVYGCENEGQDPIWSEYYANDVLRVNGTCSVSGEPDYIPLNYPPYVLTPNGKERLFLSGCTVGYVSAQKIVHTLQYMTYGAKNAERVNAEYNIKSYIKGEKSEADFKAWVDNNYPGKWDNFIKILQADNNH